MSYSLVVHSRQATSVNGEGKYNKPAACLMTVTWYNQAQTTAKVELYSMLTYERFVSWETAPGVRAVTGVEMHLQYAAVSFDASPTAGGLRGDAAPVSIALFSIYNAGGPIATYSTLTRNAVGIDLVVLPYTLPWPSPVNTDPAPSTSGDDVIYVASGDETTAVLLYTTVPSHWAP